VSKTSRSLATVVWLEQLRVWIGPWNYYAARMPCPVPLDRFREVPLGAMSHRDLTPMAVYR
jgi:hypothetical protein